MAAIFEVLMWILVMPAFCFYISVRDALAGLFRYFEPFTFFTGLWMLIGGWILLPYAAPDNLPYQTIVQSLARSSMWGVELAQCLILASPALLFISGTVRIVVRGAAHRS